jgi:hypothetical protein
MSCSYRPTSAFRSRVAALIRLISSTAASRPSFRNVAIHFAWKSTAYWAASFAAHAPSHGFDVDAPVTQVTERYRSPVVGWLYQREDPSSCASMRGPVSSRVSVTGHRRGA